MQRASNSMWDAAFGERSIGSVEKERCVAVDAVFDRRCVRCVLYRRFTLLSDVGAKASFPSSKYSHARKARGRMSVQLEGKVCGSRWGVSSKVCRKFLWAVGVFAQPCVV